jgi:hypothetical protein
MSAITASSLDKFIFGFWVCFVLVFLCYASAGNKTSHGNKVEISDYDLKYTFYVPKEYEDNITKLTDARIIVQFTSTVYMSLAVNQYFENLSEEEIGDHEASDYTIGNEVLNDTYNDQDYMTTYFTNKLTSRRVLWKSNRVMQTINNHDYGMQLIPITKNRRIPNRGNRYTETGERAHLL